jgi:hypothetical protein
MLKAVIAMLIALAVQGCGADVWTGTDDPPRESIVEVVECPTMGATTTVAFDEDPDLAPGDTLPAKATPAFDLDFGGDLAE